MENNTCPRCGAPLIVRKGRYGAFRGCTSFPNCRYADNCIPAEEIIPDDPTTYVVLDIETTGFNPTANEITEISAVRFTICERGCVREQDFTTLVHTERPIPAKITQLTGITNAMVANAPRIQDVMPALLDFLRDDPIIGHNLSFDISFLSANSPAPIANRQIDTLRLVRERMPERKGKNSLSVLVSDLHLPNHNCHRALADVLATNDLYLYLRKIR